MTNLIITGANGKMGKVIQSIVANRSDCNIVAGVDLNTEDNGHFPIYSSIFDVKEKADAIIDFSNPVLLNDLLSYSEKTSTPLVIATTGYSDEQKKQISDASKKIPVFFTYNMLDIHLFESRNRDNLRKIQNIFICRDKGQNLFLRFDRINFINNQNDRRLDLRKLLCNVALACPDEGGRLYQPENHVNLF